MQYLKPFYYDKFQCTADKCPATCCAGWQIMIDDASLERYEKTGGSFGNRLKNSIDWEEGAFYQYDRRCSFLDENNLCDIYKELGPDALCFTCRTYPRHTEEYEGLRELSLTLSCPVAASMILGCLQKVSFEESFSQEEDDFEDFDFLMFSRLEDARDVIFKIIQNRSLPLRDRMALAQKLAAEFQNCIDEDRAYDIDEVLCKYEKKNEEKRTSDIPCSFCYKDRQKELTLLESLERLDPKWSKLLRQAGRVLSYQGPKGYDKICCDFQAAMSAAACPCESGLEPDSPLDGALLENIGEQLMMFFVYTYFCGAVYDDMVWSKMGLALLSTRWILLLSMVRWQEKGQSLTFGDVVELAWRFAREIEHSDNNLDALEDWLAQNIPDMQELA